MKNYFLGALILTGFACSAQSLFSESLKGRWLASGGICYDFYDDSYEGSNGTFNSSDTWSTFKTTVGAGYGVADNQVAGLAVGYQSDIWGVSSESTSGGSSFYQEDKDFESTFFVAPFYRYYKPCGGDFAFIATGKVPIGFTNSTSSTLTDPFDPNSSETTEDPSHTSVGAYLVPSVSYSPNKNWALEATLGTIGYRTSTASEDDEKYNTNEFVAKLDLLSPTFSFVYYFDAKSE